MEEEKPELTQDETIDAIRAAMWVACAACGIPPQRAVYPAPSQEAITRASAAMVKE